jgi:hypothetical protein
VNTLQYNSRNRDFIATKADSQRSVEHKTERIKPKGKTEIRMRKMPHRRKEEIQEERKMNSGMTDGRKDFVVRRPI